LAALASPSPASAQTTPNAAPAGDTAGAPDSTVKMSAFEVQSTQGHGYVATNADAGFKTTERLLDIPQDIQVVTRDMIDDIGSSDSSVILQYFGQGGVSFLGESTAMRGFSTKYPYVDDMPENQSYEDNFFVDSYVVVRGDAQVLYVLANPTGINLKYTKKPLPYQQTLLDLSITSWGGTRAVLDTTGPLGQFGDMKFSYRFAAVQQGPNTAFYNVHESHEGLFPVLQLAVNNITTVRFSTIFIKEMHVPGGTALILPNGQLDTMAGWREVNIPPNDMEKHEEHRYHVAIDNKASDNWDFRFAASYWHYNRYNPIIEENQYSWTNQTQNWFQRLNDITIDYWTMIGDATGKYNVNGLSQQDNLGFAYEDTLTHQFLPPPPSSLWVNGAINVPLAGPGAVAGVNSLVVLPVSVFPSQGQPGAGAPLHNQGYNSSIYWQHTFDIVPKYLTGVVGWTFANVASDNIANVSVVPKTASYVAVSKWIHRFGLVAHPTKDIAVYAMESTGFAPPSGATPILYNGSQAPAQSYEDGEVGVKTAFWDGRLSLTAAVFKISETNLLTVGTNPPLNAQGSGYYVPIGAGVGEGEDADLELSLTKNWQLLAYAYMGHWNDQNGLPLPSSYDNSWSVFTRYAFDSTSSLHGLSIGGGMKCVGGAFVNAGGVTGYAFAPVPTGSTQTVKVQQGFDSQAFVTYEFTKHLLGRLSISNITDDHYATGFQSLDLADEAPPRTVTLELDLKF